MKKPHIAVSLLLFSSLGFTVNAQQHVHGQGELLVSQEGNMLHLQLVLPAADALGFEHEPETTEQLNSQNLLAERFTLNTNVIDVEGKCELVNVEHTLETHDDHHESGHDEAHNEAHEGEHASHKEHDVLGEYGEVVLTVIGSSFIAFSHIRNLRLRSQTDNETDYPHIITHK